MSDQELIHTEELTETETISSEPSAELDVIEEEVIVVTATEATPSAEDTEIPPPTKAEVTDDTLSIDNLKPGQRLVGTVKNITDFGAFVDVGIPQDGLVHISKLAKWKVDKVTDVVSQGQEVEVWVKKVDKQRGRLSLTMIRPISLRLRDLEEGVELDGTVTRLEPYGAFIDIGSEREGLVHISQISHDYIKHPEEALTINQPVKVQVLKVDRKKRQIDLSIKALLPPPQEELKQEEEIKVEEVIEEPQEELVEEGPALTAMAIAYTALQDKQQTSKTKKSAAKDKPQQSEMDDIIARTLASRS